MFTDHHSSVAIPHGDAAVEVAEVNGDMPNLLHKVQLLSFFKQSRSSLDPCESKDGGSIIVMLVYKCLNSAGPKYV